MENYYIAEDHEVCIHGCYAYEFCYGSSRVRYTIRGQGIDFYWHYTDKPGESRPRADAMKLVEDRARRALLEDLLKLKDTSEDSKATARQG